MGDLAKFWTDASVDNHIKYLIFLAIPINILLWGCESWVLRTSLLKKLEVFPHRRFRRIIGISMTEVKNKCITNETVRRSFLNILKIKEQIATLKLKLIACHFTNECYLSCCNLFFDVEYIKKFPQYRLICDALIFNLSHAYA